VFERMRAERLRVANALRAEGNEQSETIRSNADRRRAVIVAEAERDAQRLRGEGDAVAAETYAKAYGADAEFYSFYRSMEAYRNAFGDGQGVLVLDRDAEFLRYFENAGRPRR
jgi:modulator of FtsH protease HflC